MIVVDASAFVDLLTDEADDPLVEALTRSGHWVVPEHFRAEVVNALRGLWLGRRIDDAEFERALQIVSTRPLDVWPTTPLLPRIRELATNANAYVAIYVALAEELGCPLVTNDVKYVGIPGVACSIIPAARRAPIGRDSV